jgi:hypothetical protein
VWLAQILLPIGLDANGRFGYDTASQSSAPSLGGLREDSEHDILPIFPSWWREALPMNRKTVLLTLVVLVLAALWIGPSRASDGLDAAKIKAALRTAAPEEEGFVDRVVDMTVQGKLPADLVEKTFVWARSKPKLRFQYFKKAMIIQAEKIGIRL